MDTEIRVSTESRPWRRKFSRRSSRGSNPRPFNHESGALTAELSPPIQADWHTSCGQISSSRIDGSTRTDAIPSSHLYSNALTANQRQLSTNLASRQRRETCVSSCPCHRHSGRPWHTSCSQNGWSRMAGCTRTVSVHSLHLSSDARSLEFSKQGCHRRRPFPAVGSEGPFLPCGRRAHPAVGRVRLAVYGRHLQHTPVTSCVRKTMDKGRNSQAGEEIPKLVHQCMLETFFPVRKNQ